MKGSTKTEGLGAADEAILNALLRRQYLTSQQVVRLFYSPGSLTYVQSRMKRLVDGKFCQRLFLPRPAAHGSAPSVYTLARKGLAHLGRLGEEVSPRYRPSEEALHSYLFLAHTLAVNDFLIACDLLCRQEPHIRLERFLHERDLKRAPDYVTDRDGNRIAVIPDAWIDLRIDEAYRLCLALELDRGTEEQRKWRRKVRGLAGWSGSTYQKRFGTNSLTVVVVSTAGERRIINLLSWTENELETIRRKEAFDLFRFTAANPAQSTPSDLFLSPVWHRPFDPQPGPLLVFSA